MADRWLLDSTRRAKAALIDTTMPNWARVGDALSGGRDNFEADRKAVRMLAAAAPVVSAIPVAARAFRQRVVRYLVAEAGIRQFLDVSTSLAMSGNTHEVAQSLAPDCRVVYIDNDPMVLAHARAQLASAPGGAVAALDANPRDPAAILAAAAGTLDLGRPVAIMLMATLSFVLDDATASRILRSLAGATQPAAMCRSITRRATWIRRCPWRPGGGTRCPARASPSAPARSSRDCCPASIRSRPASCPSPNGAPPRTTPASSASSRCTAR